MIIREIELNNFRLYKGKNKIDLSPDGDRNLVIVSGDNGFGKTTFLMSLVWCLYGKNMGQVDELYRKEIANQGGYPKYIAGSLNHTAKNGGETEFSVSVTFTDIEIQDTPCSEITIVRSYDSSKHPEEELEILIDGRKYDWFNGEEEEAEKEKEHFIRDHILPIEIAKFFFFDAEKVVSSVSERDTEEQQKRLSQAYSRVLGIQKYEDLKGVLSEIRDDYKKESATTEERKLFRELETKIKNVEDEIANLEKNNEDLEEKRNLRETERDDLLRKLYREGSTMTQEELQSLEIEKEKHKEILEHANENLKGLYSIIPFGLAGDLMSESSDQLAKEREYEQNKFQSEEVDDKIDGILHDIEAAKKN